ncbi:MAG: thioredoxin fold domain-containing protein [Gracilimonas sp.]|uniref:thioredoxin family protein n=1 Tax=Gracilimonas TaxID=649462 RepID=UPI001B1C8E7B|nr:thioredoxin fold domain-containing protein [Gracilimonas sp.]MBO6586763.1 thioredoxin fold domain-containing protein [Gracilimonas sp.]MBO6615420.1 thioredoxin fold domain-containing protein [Gracilimonas sp.]
MAPVNNLYRLIAVIVLLYVGAYPVYGQQSQPANMQWYDFEEASRLSIEYEKDLFLFMEADWCGICKRMHHEVFTDSTIQSLLSTYFYPVRIDIESKEKLTFNGQRMTSKAFSKKMKMNATPTAIFLQPDHIVIGSKPGFMDVIELSVLLKYIQSDAWERTSLGEYRDSISVNQ